jgi:rSAM/selenodomain-associated transferase 2/rSAM/selenodomain-associated transferase 1
MTSRRLIVFAKYPVPGKAKTRLIPGLGASGAAQLHARMVEATVSGLSPVAKRYGAVTEIRTTGGAEWRFRNWLGHDIRCVDQGEGDLGRRLGRAFRDAFRRGEREVVTIGTDCPSLQERHIARAFDALRGGELVLGPASDGGYYLVGIRSSMKSDTADALFTDIPWGSAEVLGRTLDAARAADVQPVLLDELSDVDRPEDLSLWREAEQVRQERLARERISVVIPALGEQAGLRDCVASAMAGRNVELIVADGGSPDHTAELAQSLGAKVVVSRPGRARQMNEGARVAEGGILLFLHADTRLPEGYDVVVRRELDRPGVSGGAFGFSLDDASGALALVERLTNWRSRRLGLPYGDQAIFLRAERFHRLGGYRELPLMEDVDLVRRLRSSGRVSTVDAKIVTSARRWRSGGRLATSITNSLVTFLWFMGIPASSLAWIRRSIAGSRERSGEAR